MQKIIRLSFIIVITLVSPWACSNDDKSKSAPEPTNDATTPDAPEQPSENQPAVPSYKVAFIGDQGLGEGAIALLQLIKNEGATLVLHQGDFDYDDNPGAWDDQINQVLGRDFPYLASIGNHDVLAWNGYQAKLQERVNRIKEVSCAGDLGVKSVCTYQDLYIILSGVGTMGDNHAAYITEQLNASPSRWRICSWHKNQELMQVGGKSDETGWETYEACRQGGAIIATAHEHSYSRTHLMDDIDNPSVASTDNLLQISQGTTFVFVSGLGGESIRTQVDSLANNPWWAAVYTENQGADYGALFCTFNDGGDPNRASCYFKDIQGRIVDTFSLKTLLSDNSSS